MRISDWSSDVCSSDLKFSKVQPCAAAAGLCSAIMPRRLPPASVNRAVTGFIHISKEQGRRLTQSNDVGQRFFRGECPAWGRGRTFRRRSEEHTSELQSLMRTSSAFFCLQKQTNTNETQQLTPIT